MGNDLYGFTNDLRKHLSDHNKRKHDYTKEYKPWSLVYYESYASKDNIEKREKQLKHHGKT